MNTLTRTIAALIALSMLTPGLALAQDAPATEARGADAARRDAQVASRVAQQEAQSALKRQEDSVRQVQIASKARSMRVLPEAYSMLSRSFRPFQSAGASVFVVPSAEIETKELVAINEDLNVMSRVFETNLQRAHVTVLDGIGDRSSRALFNALSGRGKGSMQSLYLQGYGVLFMMKVDFPLSPSPQTPQQDETEQKEEGDKVWQDMRRKLYQPEQVATRKTGDSGVKYDAEKVENLKTTLIKALKHAANIRSLKADESVVLSITGSYAVSSGVKSMRFVPNTDQVVVVDRNNIATTYKVDSSGKAGLAAPMVLVVRAKKSDIDSFAKGDLDLEQFRQRVQMISYPFLGGETGRGSAFDLYYKSVPGARSTF